MAFPPSAIKSQTLSLYNLNDNNELGKPSSALPKPTFSLEKHATPQRSKSGNQRSSTNKFQIPYNDKSRLPSAKTDVENLNLLVADRKKRFGGSPRYLTDSLDFSENTGCVDCNDFLRSFEEPHQNYGINPHLTLHKRKNPSNKDKDDWPQQFQIGPGYVLQHSKSAIRLKINSREFFGPRATKSAPLERKTDSSIRDEFVDKLQKQIADLQMFLAEERMNHDETKQNLQSIFNEKFSQLSKSHEEYVKKLKAEKDQLEESLNKEFNRLLEDEKVRFQNMETTLKAELNYTKAAFESFAQTMKEEIARQVAQANAQLKQQLDHEHTQSLELLRNDLNELYEMQMNEMKQCHEEEINILMRENKKKISELKGELKAAKAVNVKLESTKTLLEESQTECKKLKIEIANLDQEIISYKEEIQELTKRLNRERSNFAEISQRLEERVRVVEDRYKNQLGLVRTQTVDVKRAYIKKFDEFVDEKVRLETAMRYQMIHGNTKQEESTSATTTTTDAQPPPTRAQIMADLQNQNHSESKVKRKPTDRPSSAPHRHPVNKEL